MAQVGSDLGGRLDGVVAELFRADPGPVLVLGTDVPLLTREHVDAGFEALAGGADLALGPDRGGGYYAVGLARPLPGIFDVTMSTTSVLRETERAAARRGARSVRLAPLADVDLPADLVRLAGELRDPGARARVPRTARVLRELGVGSDRDEQGASS